MPGFTSHRARICNMVDKRCNEQSRSDFRPPPQKKKIRRLSLRTRALNLRLDSSLKQSCSCARFFNVRCLSELATQNYYAFGFKPPSDYVALFQGASSLPRCRFTQPPAMTQRRSPRLRPPHLGYFIIPEGMSNDVTLNGRDIEDSRPDATKGIPTVRTFNRRSNYQEVWTITS